MSGELSRLAHASTGEFSDVATWLGEFPEFPWESGYQYKCRVYKILQYTPTLGSLSATALANVWANYHFLGNSSRNCNNYTLLFCSLLLCVLLHDVTCFSTFLIEDSKTLCCHHATYLISHYLTSQVVCILPE